MNRLEYNMIQETIYTEKLENGLEVRLIPKKGFQTTYAVLSTKFGSSDTHFVPYGAKKPVRMPNGIAHFLEHKLFEKETEDAFQTFGKQGADANAYTGYTRTAYEFSTTGCLKKNILTLLDFVQSSYFTENSVVKERKIIEQEILMYENDPDWRLFSGLMENLYPDQPIHVDIAGTVQSIRQITAPLLEMNYQTFYHPSNMKLIVVGKMDPEKVMEWVRINQQAKYFEPAKEIVRVYPPVILDHLISYRSIYLPVSRPKTIVGVRGRQSTLQKQHSLKQRLTMELLMDLLFGANSSNYLTLYDQGLIDDSFSFEYVSEGRYDFVTVGGDTSDPDKLSARLKEILLKASSSSELTEENLLFNKKRKLGRLIQSLNSVESIADQFLEYDHTESSFFDIFPLVENITLEEVRYSAENYFTEQVLSVFQISPERII